MTKQEKCLKNTSISKKIAAIANDKELKKKLFENKEWYTIRAILGNNWANWFVLIGAR